QIPDDLVPRHEPVGILVLIIRARQVRLPVRCVERERIPAMVAPGLARPVGFLEDDVVSSLTAQMIAERKSGLAAADDDGVHGSGHGVLLSHSERHCLLLAASSDERPPGPVPAAWRRGSPRTWRCRRESRA